MTYPGDSTLADDIKDRILATFDQALDLSDKGSRKEALLGCDFVLRLDPLFEPARVLHRRLSAGDMVRTDDLRAASNNGGDLAASAESGASPAIEPAPFPSEPARQEEPATGPLDPASLGATPEETPVDGREASDDADAVDDAATGPLRDLRADGEMMTTFVDEVVEDPDPDVDLATPEYERPAYQAPTYAEREDVEREGDDPATETPEPLGGSPQLDEESRQRIDELLEEGQVAYDAGQYQSAIDAWSRVFLIDIDHAEANQRIEQARRMSAEVERQVEEVFHDAMMHLDNGDHESAREALDRVLELQPGHLAAQEYVERLDSGDIAAGAPLPDATEDLTPAGFPLDETYQEDDEREGAEDLFATPDVAPDTADFRVPAEAVASVPAPKKRPTRTFLLVGLGVLLLVAVGGWFLIDSWDSLFPNSESAQPAPIRTRIDPIARAHKLHEQGKTAIAIAQLRRLPPGDPHYSEAQALVAQWETAESAEPAGPQPQELEQHQDLVSRAEAAFAQRENLLASVLLERAAAIAPLDPGMETLATDAERALEPLQEPIRYFRAGDWEYALPVLWKMREKDRDNPDVNRLIVDSYYNLGVRDLQRGRPEAAAKKFEEALGLRPGDSTLERLRSFSMAYEARGEDLLYRIFVKYLPYR